MDSERIEELIGRVDSLCAVVERLVDILAPKPPGPGPTDYLELARRRMSEENHKKEMGKL